MTHENFRELHHAEVLMEEQSEVLWLHMMLFFLEDLSEFFEGGTTENKYSYLTRLNVFGRRRHWLLRLCRRRRVSWLLFGDILCFYRAITCSVLIFSRRRCSSLILFGLRCRTRWSSCRRFRWSSSCGRYGLSCRSFTEFFQIYNPNWSLLGESKSHR